MERNKQYTPMLRTHYDKRKDTTASGLNESNLLRDNNIFQFIYCKM